jgi:hypothetical protein
MAEPTGSFARKHSRWRRIRGYARLSAFMAVAAWDCDAG